MKKHRDPEEPHFPKRIRARLRVSGDNAARNGEAIDARMGKERREALIARLDACVTGVGTAETRLRELYAIVDEWMSYNGENVACRRGCNHCCHIAVAVFEDEAKMIGAHLNVEPEKPPRYRMDFNDVPFGPSFPCTFLKNGECSIYEHRPLNCRTHVNMDVDALLCEMRDGACYSAPLMNSVLFNCAYIYICAPGAQFGEQPKLAELREFFPLKKTGES